MSLFEPPVSTWFVSHFVSRDMKLHTTLLGGLCSDQALRFAAGILGKRASGGRWLVPLLSEVWSLPDNVANLGASIRERARMGGHGQKIEHSYASLMATSHKRLFKA